MKKIYVETKQELRQLILNKRLTNKTKLKYDYSHITDWSYLMSSSNIKEFPLLNTSNVINMDNMFWECFCLETIPLLDTTNVTSMMSMFYNCKSLLNVPLLNTSNVTNMSHMFSNCSSLKEIPAFNIKNVKFMSYFAYFSTNLEKVPLLDLSSVKQREFLFSNCFKLVKFPVEIFRMYKGYDDFQMNTIPKNFNYQDYAYKFLSN